MVLLDTGTPGTSREIYSEDADGETRTRNPRALKMVKKSETIDGFFPQGEVCQSGSGLERLVFQNCHGRHPLDV